VSRIQLDALTKRFGPTTAVDGVDLAVGDGEFVVLLGPSGCGKSTLLRMVAGLIPATSGRVVVDGRDVTDVPPRDRDLAMVFQSYALYPHLTVEKNIGFPLRARGTSRAEIRRQVGEVAADLGLSDLLHRRPKELSGGQRQRVALGRALVRSPGAFLMDEPLSNLDARLRTATRTGLTALHRRLGATVLYVTHDQVEAMTMATRIVLLDDGHVEQVGTPTEVYDHPATTFVAGFLGAPPMNLLPATASVRDGRLHAVADGLDVTVLPDAAGDTTDRDVTVGVRPEHLVLASADDSSVVARGEVADVENLGNEEIARVAVGDEVLSVRGPRPLRVSVGDRVALATDPAHVHLFDRATGRRLQWHDTRVPALSTASSS